MQLLRLSISRFPILHNQNRTKFISWSLWEFQSFHFGFTMGLGLFFIFKGQKSELLAYAKSGSGLYTWHVAVTVLTSDAIFHCRRNISEESKVPPHRRASWWDAAWWHLTKASCSGATGAHKLMLQMLQMDHQAACPGFWQCVGITPHPCLPHVCCKQGEEDGKKKGSVEE